MRTLIHFSALPRTHWFGALSYATYAHNRTPRRFDGKYDTPYRRAHGIIPDLCMLKIFGCLSYVIKSDEQRENKLAEKAELGYNIGPSREVRGWVIFLPSQSKYYHVRHVRFDEKRFYSHGALDPMAKGNHSHPKEYGEDTSDD